MILDRSLSHFRGVRWSHQLLFPPSLRYVRSLLREIGRQCRLFIAAISELVR